MKTSIIETIPTRDNWEQFCEEPELTKEEWAIWYDLAEVARENEEVAAFIETEAADEIAECDHATIHAKDWSDMVEWADGHRRWRRAVLAAWEKWQEGRHKEYHDSLRSRDHQANGK
jgi:hypothetical protein